VVVLLESLLKIFADADIEPFACGAPKDIDEIWLATDSGHAEWFFGKRGLVAGAGFEPATFGL
jgi:hypothetical protein